MLPRILMSVAPGLAHTGNQQPTQAAGRTRNRLVAAGGQVVGAWIYGQRVERRRRVFVGHPDSAANLLDADPDLSSSVGPVAMLNGICKKLLDRQLDSVNQVRCDAELPATSPNQVYDSPKLAGASRKNMGGTLFGVGRNHGA